MLLCCAGRGLCFGLVTRPTERDVSECDCEVTIMRNPWPTTGCCLVENIKELRAKHVPNSDSSNDLEP
jgi:hypothetical protein